MKEKPPMVTIGISVPLDLRKRLVEQSRQKYKSMSALCREYLEGGLNRAVKRLPAASMVLLLALAVAAPVLGDGAHPCYGLLPADCQAVLEARERGGPSSSSERSRVADREPERVPAQAETPEKVATLPPLRPANLSVSTTAGVTTIAWVAPLNPDGAHCPIYFYAVTVVDLAEDADAYDSGNVLTQFVITPRLKPGVQYDVEVSAYSASCNRWSEPGLYTYQY